MLDVRILQIASAEQETYSARIERVQNLLLAQQGADLIALPEMWATGFFNFDNYRQDARPAVIAENEVLQVCAQAALALKAHVHCGSFVEINDSGKLFNTAVLIDNTGTIVHKSSKLHPFTYKSREADFISGAESLPVVAVNSLNGLKVGTAICYDLRFGSQWARLRQKGAELVFAPAAWPAKRSAQRNLLLRARALEGNMFIIGAASATADAPGSLPMSGQSMIVDPLGTVVAVAGDDTQQVVRALIDSTYVASVRAQMNTLNDMRADYHLL